MSTDYIIVFITASNEIEARNISDALLNQKKAACVNIIPEINSSFWWQGTKESTSESLLIIKTKVSMLDDIVKMIKQGHSYEIPEVIAMPIVGGNADYLKWLEETLK